MNLFKKENKDTEKKAEKNTSAAIKYGSYASVMTAIVIVAVIIINLIVSSFGIKFDLTKNKLYTFSEDTITLLKNLEDDVKITSVYAEGTEVSIVTEILDKYASYSKHVTVENVDPYTNPTFAAKYASNGDVVSIGAVVVEAKGNYKIIPQDELADVYVDQTTGESYMQGLKLEGVLTGAIRSLVSGETRMAYELTGHGEISIGDDLIKELGYSGFALETLSLLTAGSVPDDCEVLIINGAVTDITEAELDAINEYLDKGGSAFITLGITTEETTNIDSLFENYGIKDSKTMVIEGSADYVYNSNPFYVVPDLNEESSITKAMVSAGTKAFMPFAGAVELSEAKRSTVEITTLAQSSQYSYGKAFSTMTSYEKEDSDAVGPFNLAVSVEDSDGGARLVVCGAETVLDSDINNVVNGGNFGFVMNCIDYLTGSDSSSRSKSLGAEDYLQLTQSKAIAIMFVCVVVIPLVILIAGIVVTVRRRNR